MVDCSSLAQQAKQAPMRFRPIHHSLLCTRAALVVQPHAISQPLRIRAVEFIDFAAAAEHVEMRAVPDVLHAHVQCNTLRAPAKSRKNESLQGVYLRCHALPQAALNEELAIATPKLWRKTSTLTASFIVSTDATT